MKTTSRSVGFAMAGLVCAVASMYQPALAAEIRFRSFSGSAAIGPPADAYAAKLLNVSTTVLGAANEVRFTRLAGIPAIPSQFGGNIVAAVAAGQSGGGFDAAYISGSDLNRAWGFLYNSGTPFGPTFDEFVGFLYGKSIGGSQSGLDLLQSLLDARGANVVAFPIVGSPEQLSGYFPEPIGHAPGNPGIGLAGLCEKPWTLRYLPPGENVLKTACARLLASGKISAVNLSFIAAVPGGGSLIAGVKSGTIQGFEFATPVDDVSQVFNTADNPGTVGVRYVHLPGWQQQFLVTYMLVNKSVWNGLTAAQQTLAQTVARDHVLSSYGENLRQQGPALRFILEANRNDGNPANDMVLVQWPEKDQEELRDATIRFLNARVTDPGLAAADRTDYAGVLEAMRSYVNANDLYWDRRQVKTTLRFEDWVNVEGLPWEQALPKKKDH